MHFIVRVHGYGRPELEFFDNEEFAIESFERARARQTDTSHSWTQLWLQGKLWGEF